MLNKNITKYITLPDNGIAGQDARTKEWYCKELPFKDADDLETKVDNINKVLKKYNKKEMVPAPSKEKKTKTG